MAEECLRAAITKADGPWERLSAACITMLEIQLDPDSLTMPLMSNFLSVPAEVRERLVAKRDVFERMFVELIADIPLAQGIDRGVYRLLLLTLLNNVSGWYRPGRLTPEEIGRQILKIFRHDEIE